MIKVQTESIKIAQKLKRIQSTYSRESLECNNEAQV